MQLNQRMLDLVKLPLLLAFAIIVLRMVIEYLGAPLALQFVVGVAWLHILLPIYFARKIMEYGEERPFRSLMVATLYFTIPVRLVVALTYVIAYAFDWPGFRFTPEAFGPVGENMTALKGYLLLPLLNFVSWVIQAFALSAVIGGITLKLRKRSTTHA